MKTSQPRTQPDQAHSAAPSNSQRRQAPAQQPATVIASSPRMAGQRQGIRAAFGPAAAPAQLQGDGHGVVQRVNIQVGFDGTATQSMFAGPADDLTTTGLGNCIAIVAYHTGAPSQGAVMRHYDTLNAFVGMAHDPVSGGQALTFNAATIGAIATATAALLVNQVPAAAGHTGFAVAIGGVWSDVDPGTTRWQSRFNLINAIVAATGVEPQIAAGTVNFDVATSTLT